MTEISPVDHAISHEVRRQIIEALWHNAEPLTAEQFFAEYVHDDRTLAMVVYHVRQLDLDGIVELDPGWEKSPETSPFVLNGPNSSEAVRRIPGLTATS